MLSEVSPNYSIKNIAEQAYTWFGLLTLEECTLISEAHPKHYGSIIKLLYKRAEEKGCKLIIRDLSYYTLNPNVLRNCFNTKEVVFTRDFKQAYTSFNAVSKKGITLELFAKRALGYAKIVKDLPLYKYEDFCEEPKEIVKNICKDLDIHYNDNFLEDYHKYFYCRGDKFGENKSKNFFRKKIVDPTIHDLEKKVQENEYLTKANMLLGYK